MNQEQAAVAVPIGRGPIISDEVVNGSSLAPSRENPVEPPQNPQVMAQTTAATNGNHRAVHTPLIDIYEGAEGLVLEADLPGVAEGQITIQLEENVLSLHARSSSVHPEGARVLHQEFRPGDFYRSFILSDEVDRARISAVLKNGVLKLTLPKAERAKTRRIEIKKG